MKEAGEKGINPKGKKIMKKTKKKPKDKRTTEQTKEIVYYVYIMAADIASGPPYTMQVCIHGAPIMIIM